MILEFVKIENLNLTTKELVKIFTVNIMKDTEIIIEVAKLDNHINPEYNMGVLYAGVEESIYILDGDYLTSRDAIIPVIEKEIQRDSNQAYEIMDELDEQGVDFYFMATARQLCIALLKATGKYHD